MLLTATPIQLGQTGHFGRLRLLDPQALHGSRGLPARSVPIPEPGRHRGPHPGERIARARGRGSLVVGLSGDAALRAKLDAYVGGAARIAARPDRGSGRSPRHGPPDVPQPALGLGRLSGARGASRPPRQRSRASANGPPPWPGPNPAAGTDPSRTNPSSPRFLNGPAAYASGDLKGFEGRRLRIPQARVAQGSAPGLAGRICSRSWKTRRSCCICSHKGVVFALQEILPTLTAAPFAAFHENLTMATRDKNAAYFAQPDGARMLDLLRDRQRGPQLPIRASPGAVRSAAGSQRAGAAHRPPGSHRAEARHPHPRALRDSGTAHEVLYRWYQEGMDAFRHPVLGSDYFHEEQIGDVMETCRLAVIARSRWIPRSAAHRRRPAPLPRNQARSAAGAHPDPGRARARDPGKGPRPPAGNQFQPSGTGHAP